MNAVGETLDRKERPAYVKFERIAVEDKAASLAAGHYVARDVDYANITPPYSKDVFKTKVTQWLLDLEQQVQNDRIPREWVDNYKKAYQAWQNGQEAPLSGTAIKGWGVISPAQQETLIRMNVLTVEDLAVINDEGLKRIGMGSLDLKNKAVAWLSQLQDKGPLTQEIAAVKAENLLLQGSVTTLTRQVQELTEMVRAVRENPNVEALYSPAFAAKEVVDVNEILDDGPLDRETLVSQYTDKFGKPPHHMKKLETIAKELAE
jgi:hypothetical protein